VDFLFRRRTVCKDLNQFGPEGVRAGSAVQTEAELEDLGPESLEHLCCFLAGISIDLEACKARRPEQYWHKLLHYRAVEVRQNGIGVGVGFDEPGIFCDQHSSTITAWKVLRKWGWR